MSKMVYVYSRQPLDDDLVPKLEYICRLIGTPDLDVQPLVKKSEYSAFAVASPTPSVQVQKNSLLLGQLLPDLDDWHCRPSSELDGTYLACRDFDDYLEFCTDAAGSRTLWYFLDDDWCIVSSSQRAIVMLRQQFDYNPNVTPWVLSSGTLGPYLSWDRQISMLPPDSTLTLNKKTWKTSLERRGQTFDCFPQTMEQAKAELSQKIKQTFASLNLDWSRWVLTLSGGYDSRGILIFLNEADLDIRGLRCVTLGRENALYEEGNDAYVAQTVAKHFHHQHEFHTNDLPESFDIERKLFEFILMAEGRIDHVASINNSSVYQRLYQNNVRGIVRGDEGFGWVNAEISRDVIFSIGCTMCSDFQNLSQASQWGLADQKFPADWQRQPQEPLADWRDRLYRQFRLPLVLAALADRVLGYFEMVNPFLSRRLLDLVRTLPADLRTEKDIFCQLIHDRGPKIPMAHADAQRFPASLFKSQEFLELLHDELQSNHAQRLIPDQITQPVMAGLSRPPSPPRRPSFKNRLISAVKPLGHRILPASVKRKIREQKPLPWLANDKLALRIYTVCRMYRQLSEDARALKEMRKSKGKN